MYNDLKNTTMQINRIITLMALTALMSMSAQAQSEGGLFLEAAAEKKINKQLNVSLETELSDAVRILTNRRPLECGINCRL